MSRKVILTCAVTGNAPLNPKYPYVYPVTPAQICDAVIEALGQTPRPGSGLLEKDLHRPIGPGLNTADGSS